MAISERPDAAAAPPPPASTTAPRRPLVLVVDDSEIIRGLVHDVLEPDGYEVVAAASGMRALIVMADRLPDLVITDLLMPAMSGFALRSAMLRRPELAHIPVVVLSGYWQRPSETLDAADVLSKPINVDQLRACVRRVAPLPENAAEGSQS